MTLYKELFRPFLISSSSLPTTPPSSLPQNGVIRDNYSFSGYLKKRLTSKFILFIRYSSVHFLHPITMFLQFVFT